MLQTDLIVIGGGASGMTAALSAAYAGARVLIIEHKERVGKKILSTGNGRCNLSNSSVSETDYGGKDPGFVRPVLTACGVEETRSFFRRIGVPTVAEDGRIYPRTMQAQTVLDALRFALARENIIVKTGTGVVSAVKDGSVFRLKTDRGETFLSKSLLFAVGGLAAPKTGSDGSANTLITGFGHKIRRQLPALVPLLTDAACRKALCGLRIDGEIALYIDGIYVRSEKGQLQMTDSGISGIPVFQLSDEAAEALSQKRQVQVCMDFLPDLSAEAAQEELSMRLAAFAKDDVQTALNGFLPKKLVIELCKLSGMRPSDPVCTFQRTGKEQDPGTLPASFQTFAALSKGFFQNVTGTKGFDAAQTTCGGVLTSELKPTLESRLVPGLYFSGEIIDIHGRCGGYNLQWAFSSGLTAGKNAALSSV